MNLLGEILNIDLTTRTVTAAPLEDAATRRYLGGRGLNVWQLQQRVGPEVDALGPENVLLLSCGLLTGTEAPVSSRLQIGARSPLTGLLGSSNVGGHFGAALRSAGYQSVQITGQADAPVYLWIDANGVEIRDAAALWGLDTRATAAALKVQAAERDAKIMTIGPAGENLARYASLIMADGHAAGRTGLGAVMGSKRLKAIVITHTPSRRPPDPATRSLMQAYAQSIRSAERYEIYARYSNSAYLNWSNEMGILGTRNFQEAQFDGSEKIDGVEIARYVTKVKSCHRCPVHCKAEIRVDHGRFAVMLGERPDIEPLMAMGPRIGVDDPEAVLYLFSLSNTLGLDVISAGGAVAFAIDLYQRGILTDDDTGGLALNWGDAEAVATLMRQIAHREGLGNALAEGVRAAAQRIGGDAAHFAYHTKGLELPGYDPRGAFGTALGYAVSNRGADFTSVYPTQEFFWSPEQGRDILGDPKAVERLAPEGKGALVRYASIVSAVLDSLGLCKIPVLSIVGDFSLENEARLASALSGWDLTAEDLFEAGERIVNAERRFNLACGMTPGDDDLPDRFVEEPIPGGPTQGRTVPLQTMLRDFYRAMGWDREGRPPEATA
ncbi:MAG: aldehyde ferredoxin oxidoreductase family protein [Anaerolineae bacterium]